MADVAEDTTLVVRVPRACEMLSISRRKLYRLLSDGTIPSYLDGRDRKIPVNALKAYVERKLEDAHWG